MNITKENLDICYNMKKINGDECKVEIFQYQDTYVIYTFKDNYMHVSLI